MTRMSFLRWYNNTFAKIIENIPDSMWIFYKCIQTICCLWTSSPQWTREDIFRAHCTLINARGNSLAKSELQLFCCCSLHGFWRLKLFERHRKCVFLFFKVNWQEIVFILMGPIAATTEDLGLCTSIPQASQWIMDKAAHSRQLYGFVLFLSFFLPPSLLSFFLSCRRRKYLWSKYLTVKSNTFNN